MKRYLLLFLLVPIFSMAQIEKSLQLKIAILQSFAKQGMEGETAFWQTKGKITFAIVNYTDAQNPVFKDLFINQYREILPIFQQMAATQDEKASAEFLRLIVKHEEQYRQLLTKEQLALYRAKLAELEIKDPKLSDSYSALYFSDKLLDEYKSKF